MNIKISAINKPAMTTVESLGEFLFRLRDYTPVPIILIAVVFAKPTLVSILLGIVVALFGELCRAYGVAFIGTISRTRSYSNGELIQTGPFSALRNPLYFGNLLLSLGLSLMTAIPWLCPLTLVLFYAQYIPIVKWEEYKLRNIFNENYEAYCHAVPNRWFPKLNAIISGRALAKVESWRPAIKSEKRTFLAIFLFIVTMLTFFIWDNNYNRTMLPLINKFL